MSNDVWNEILSITQENLSKQAFEIWLAPTRFLSFSKESLDIEVPNKFFKDWIIDHYFDAIKLAANKVLNYSPEIKFHISRDKTYQKLFSSETSSYLPKNVIYQYLNSKYTFDSFVVGSCNQFARAACQAVAENPSSAYNPLFIYGGVGLGKTHLLHAIGNHINKSSPHLTVFYLSSERFTNDLINSIRFNKTAEFRNKYRNIDVLLLDDIQFISGKERTQEEFFHTFNDLYESHRQIVLSSDSPPKDIPEIEERLRSRFEWGLIADIQPPDFETRVAILKKKAELERTKLPDEISFLIASKIKSNIRELEGSLTRMIAYCSLTGREMTVELAEKTISEIWGKDQKVITIEHIQHKVADFFGIKNSDIRSKTRTKVIAFPRQVAMYIARTTTNASLSDIGKNFGGKDHSTVIHAVEKIENYLKEDINFRKTFDKLINSIKM